MPAGAPRSLRAPGSRAQAAGAAELHRPGNFFGEAQRAHALTAAVLAGRAAHHHGGSGLPVEGVLQQVRELGAAERDVALPLSEGGHHVAQSEQAPIDLDGLLLARSLGLRLVESLRPCEVHDLKLGAGSFFPWRHEVEGHDQMGPAAGCIACSPARDPEVKSRVQHLQGFSWARNRHPFLALGLRPARHRVQPHIQHAPSQQVAHVLVVYFLGRDEEVVATAGPVEKAFDGLLCHAVPPAAAKQRVRLAAARLPVGQDGHTETLNGGLHERGELGKGVGLG
mmetsp:Transcript_11046/g.30974  ORF Transcript_11046/g.30974 Transcript_11046/m.30974 type:complete len:282 (-) Transcript_11046:46-891(-)